MTFSASRGQKAMPIAGGEEHLVLLQLEGAADLREHAARQLRHGAAVVGVGRQIVDEHRELVAGEPADHGFLRQRARQALGEDLERAIAGRMAEGVVDLLEAIHVEVQQRERGLVAQRARDRLLQQVLELHAVRHLGQRVVTREVADAPLGALALGDVAHHEDGALVLRIVGGDLRAGDAPPGWSGRGAS